MGSTTTKKGAHTLNKSAHIRKRMKRKMLKNVNDKKKERKKNNRHQKPVSGIQVP
jgi:hypothetical protein